MKKKFRDVDWMNDSTHVTLAKIYASDGVPGATAAIDGQQYHLYGASPVFV